MTTNMSHKKFKKLRLKKINCHDIKVDVWIVNILSNSIIEINIDAASNKKQSYLGAAHNFNAFIPKYEDLINIGVPFCSPFKK